MKEVYNKGDSKNPSTHFELMDLHANYQDKLTLTNIGGHFQQLYYVVCSIFELYGDDLSEMYKRRKDDPKSEDSKKAMTARELLVEQFFLPFLATYLRDNKVEAFTFMCTPEMQQHMQDMKVLTHNAGHYDLAKMNKE